MPLPELQGILRATDVAATAATIAAAQEASGAIPWFPGGHTDPWDHVECAMALDVAGRHDAADAAYDWLVATQRADGSWPARIEQGRVTQPHTDANFCGYMAVGIWHHHLITGDEAALRRRWPTVRRALGRVIAMQRPGGQIGWAADVEGIADRGLITSSSSLHQALRCGLAIAAHLGEAWPAAELAVGRLAHAVVHHPERFEVKPRFSMDWYYPVLGGVVRGRAGHARLDVQRAAFWAPGLGVRCVADQPWVTGAETCEYALALHALGRRDEALDALTVMQHLRHHDGSYWTGHQYALGIRWPDERTTWTGAAVILAADALSAATPGAGIFVATDLPTGPDHQTVTCADARCARPSGPARAA